ncbi:YbaK/EbsC family protein [Nocardia mangyaensis]|uniref:YbaK/EbsC family protein n=1 Tax=Nocardia mangyaensis TaxID=2213200 RepID=UPI0026764C4B|nr:YbaK/EbsC family protein [Nocardia mangyaensis]MDO3650974.1 YbaK/EbsC family protein [Nocardia mangyaensis]
MRRSSLPAVACRVADTLIARGHHGVLVSPETPTATAADAARALGIHPTAIITAQVFLLDDDPVLLLVACHHRVDLTRTGNRLEGTLTPAPTALIERVTGQPIDGTAPVGHPTNLPTWVDTALADHREVWAAGGHPNTVFRTNFRELVRITAGLPIEVD